MLVRSLLDTVLNIEVSGIENIPMEGGGILICNHTDAIDPPIQGIYSKRKLIFLGKAELFEPDKEIKGFLFQKGSPLNSPFMMLAKPVIEKLLEFYALMQSSQFKEWGGLPVTRNYKGDSARAAVEYYQELENYMVDIVKKGNILSIFPEGTRTDTGLMGPFKAMAAKLAIRAQVPIIPSGINGAFKFSSPESILTGQILRRKISYNVGQPIQPKDFPQGDEKKAAKELTAFLEKQVYALTLHPERRGHARGKAREL